MACSSGAPAASSKPGAGWGSSGAGAGEGTGKVPRICRSDTPSSLPLVLDLLLGLLEPLEYLLSAICLGQTAGGQLLQQRRPAVHGLPDLTQRRIQLLIRCGQLDSQQPSGQRSRAAAGLSGPLQILTSQIRQISHS